MEDVRSFKVFWSDLKFLLIAPIVVFLEEPPSVFQAPGFDAFGAAVNWEAV